MAAEVFDGSITDLYIPKKSAWRTLGLLGGMSWNRLCRTTAFSTSACANAWVDCIRAAVAA